MNPGAVLGAQQGSNEQMIRFDHVSKVYKRGARPALDDVDIKVNRDEFVFLVGASGSGKSTFLRLVLREERPTKGRIHVLGRDLSQISSWKVPQLRREIGFVFQDFRLLENKNVLENVALASQVIGKPRHYILSAVPEALDLVGLAGKEKRLPHELSGGEQQRVAIARAMVNRPKLLLADEPTGNLDPSTSVGIMRLLDRINRQGTTVVMATHDDEIVTSRSFIPQDDTSKITKTATVRLSPSRAGAELTASDLAGALRFLAPYPQEARTLTMLNTKTRSNQV